MSRAGATLAGSLADAAARALEQLRARARPLPSFREFLESEDYCGEKLSAAIAAIADASAGHPVTTLAPEVVRAIFHCGPEELPRKPPRVVAISAGGRGGKTSKCLGPRAVHAAWTTPLRAPGAPVDPRHPLAQELGHGERAVAILIAPKRKLAKQAMSFARGHVLRSPILRAALVGKPGAESMVLRRPDGIEVEVLVVTADKGGASARGRTLVFAGLDEASFFAGQGYAINDEDVFSAVIQRVVPYGQVWVVSTPWIEGEGLLERFVASDWGKHENALVVARVGTRLLNPTWDPDGSIERTERARPGGVENADREILAIPLPRGTRCFFPIDAIRAACLRMPEGSREERGAGVDLGHGGSTSQDNSALAIADRLFGADARALFAPVLLFEIPSSPDQLPSATYKAFALRLVDHQVGRVAGDPHYKRTFEEELRKHGIAFVDSPGKDVLYMAARVVLTDDRLALGHLPEEQREQLVDQLGSVVSKPLVGGRVQILQPRRKVGEMGISAGHCDTVSALVVALAQCGSLEPYRWQKPDARPPPPASAKEQRAGGSGVSLSWLRDRSAGHSDWYRKR